MLNTLLVIACSSLAACTAVFTLGRCSAPITVNDAKVMWMMHRKGTHCSGHKWEPIKGKKDKIIGFRCECGHKYTQKRPLVCSAPKHHEEHSELPALYFF